MIRPEVDGTLKSKNEVPLAQPLGERLVPVLVTAVRKDVQLTEQTKLYSHPLLASVLYKLIEQTKLYNSRTFDFPYFIN